MGLNSTYIGYRIFCVRRRYKRKLEVAIFKRKSDFQIVFNLMVFNFSGINEMFPPTYGLGKSRKHYLRIICSIQISKYSFTLITLQSRLRAVLLPLHYLWQIRRSWAVSLPNSVRLPKHLLKNWCLDHRKYIFENLVFRNSLQSMLRNP